MKIKIDAEGGGLLDAMEYAATHVIVSRADLDKIKAWARGKGLYRELKALGIEMQEIEVPGHVAKVTKKARK